MATPKDSHLTSGMASSIVPVTEWIAQTFTASATYDAASIQFWMYRLAGENPGTITISLKATTAGVPSGADLASLTVDGSTISTSTNGDATERLFSSATTLTSGTVYAIIIRKTGTDQLLYRQDSNGGYANGEKLINFSSGDAASWETIVGTYDLKFAVYEAYSPAKATVPAPTDAASGTEVGTQELSWTKGTDGVSVEVYFGESGSAVLVASQDDAYETWDIPIDTIEYGTAYEWRIDSIGLHGDTTGDTWTFTTLVFDPPVASGPNGMTLIKRLVGAAGNKFWYEDI